MQLLPTSLPDVLIVKAQRHDDARGWLAETFRDEAWRAAWAARHQAAPGPFVQDNQSLSHAGVLRGLHWQAAPHAQGKLVRCLRGRVFDVAVDLRADAPTFGRWVGIELRPDPQQQVWIPPGFAHGFLALEESELAYRMTAPRRPQAERRLRWDDPQVAIHWPLSGAPVLSSADAAAPALDAI